MGCMKVIVRHFVGLLAFFTWLSGTIIIAICLWTIATSSNFNQLIDGKLPVTYFTLGFGGLLFLNDDYHMVIIVRRRMFNSNEVSGLLGCLQCCGLGLLGWTGASKKNSILLKLFIILSFLIILAEVGAIITICIFKANSGQLIDQTWQELNKKSHNVIQEQLICCGLNGPNDYDSSRDIDQSCFYREPDLPKNVGENGLVISEDPPPVNFAKERKINQIGCRARLSDWFFDNRLLVLAVLGSLLMYQIITMLLTSAAISLGRRRRDDDSFEELETGSNHHLHHHGATYM